VIQTGDVLLASETILRLSPDAVLTRILPKRFGIELVRALRTNVVMTTVPIVILTSLGHSRILEEARCCGATEVLLLPVGADEIADLLGRHLRTQRSA
jgi:DNA-binding response OmpR family regulator